MAILDSITVTIRAIGPEKVIFFGLMHKEKKAIMFMRLIPKVTDKALYYVTVFNTVTACLRDFRYVMDRYDGDMAFSMTSDGYEIVQSVDLKPIKVEVVE